LLPAEYPLLLRFGNIADPRTVEQVDPDNLAASFGYGVRLKRITITMLGKTPVTKGISKYLPSFGKGSSISELHKTLPYGHPRRINLTHFMQGTK
jgi:hypothetical protein